jgi:branched-chain amino acid transport system ATP-binding protein
MSTNTQTNKLLQVSKLQAGYGASQVLFDIEFYLNAGEVITLLGRNGMGKSTIVKCLSGMLAPSSGSIEFVGQAAERLPSYKIARLGLGLVPEGRHVFPTLSVRENLVATAHTRNLVAGQQAWTYERVVTLFPRLGERARQLAASLSGGEQQMLAIGRALMTNPRLLILDEATEGLAPIIRLEIWRCLESLRSAGQAMIVIDKNLKHLLPLAQRHYVVEKGRIAWQGDSAQLEANLGTIQKMLGV